MSIVEQVFQYRTLLGRCELGIGLELDDIAALGVLEAELAPAHDGQADVERRRPRRDGLVIGALLRGPGVNDRVAVRDFGPGGVAVSGAPYACEGDLVEIVIDAGDLSYRFKGRVEWVREDGDDYAVGMSFIGLPVRLRYGTTSPPATDAALDQIAA